MLISHDKVAEDGKLCPMSLQPSQSPAHDLYCAGHLCMAWRFMDEQGRAAPDVSPGYCGMAGRPAR